MLRALLAVPIEQGHAESQQSGRVAKSLDAYVAHELRRAGFDPSTVFPRLRMPRDLPPEMKDVEEAIDHLVTVLDEYESFASQKLKPAQLRSAIMRLARVKLGGSETTYSGASTGSR